jgi:PleD family two-component response regulator
LILKLACTTNCFFNGCYQKKLALAKRNDAPLSLVMLEFKKCTLFDGQPTSQITIDHLKVLSQIISTILSRPTDTLTRYSDNEFAILLPNTYIFGAKYIIQKVLTLVADFKSKDDLTFGKIDITAGMASLEALQKNTNLIELIEKNLTQNKQSNNAMVSRYYIN